MLKSLFKGWLGETMTNFVSWIALDENIYYRLNDVTLPKNENMTTQIDHIIISKYGIFVIETKNYKGWIFGNETQEQWTQILSADKKFQFYNPIRQNYGHIKTLSLLLNLDVTYFHSIIWFSPDCELKTQHELPDFVINQGLIAYIKSKNKEILNQQQVLHIVEIIKNQQLKKGLKTKFQHHKNVKNHLQTKQQAPTCPICQTTMTKRTAKNGLHAQKTFWGCSRYPTCRGIRQID